MRAQLDAFARATRGDPTALIFQCDLLATVASFEATVRALEGGGPVDVEPVSRV
ncbi:MAG: hypothetical protein H7125_06360 [Proteobacteria bacterium]|nr:hypothetical protein [Burkholderiales bacterium]